MTISPHLHRGGEALSHQVPKGGPIEKPAKREKAPSRLSRKSEMTRRPSRLHKTPLGHASAEQKAKVEREGPRLETLISIPAEEVDPAHIVPRGIGGCDHEDCVIGLKRADHRAYDRGEVDILPHLTLEEQAHTVSHLGILGALKRTTGERYVPESEVG